MPIQIFLTAILSLLLVTTILRWRKFPPVGASLIIITSFAILLVWWPSLAQTAATFAGVGRGVDLIFYSFIVVTLCVSAWLFLSLKSADMRTTVLARELAILTARTPSNTENSKIDKTINLRKSDQKRGGDNA